MSTIQRITGTNSGLDVDALVKASMATYQNRIDKETQNQKILGYKQEQYKQIMSDASNFYDKYFDVLKTGNLFSTSTYQSVSFESGDDTKVTAKGFAGADVSNYEVTVDTIASKATASFKADDLLTATKLYVKVDGKDAVFVDIPNTGDKEADMETAAKNLNIKLNDAGINVSAKYSEFSDGIVLESGVMGESSKFYAVAATDGSTISDVANTYTGKNATGTIKKGTETYTIDQTNNTFTVDNVQFTLKATTTTSVSLTGSTNVTDLKDKIVSFVNDYNTLLQSINTKLYEERDTDYMPLTDAQREEMTDDQIEKWETKAKTGLLRKDSDLERIANAMKSAMSTVMSGSGLYLEKIGISPVDDYAEKNGMLTVDEDTLTQALEENAGNIKDLFTRSASTTNTNDKGGVFTQLKSVLSNEFKSSTSSLSKKAGLEGTSTEYNNTLTKSIYEKKLLIDELNDQFSDKEDALYNKYSALETALESLNAQQASLASMLGTS